MSLVKTNAIAQRACISFEYKQQQKRLPRSFRQMASKEFTFAFVDAPISLGIKKYNIYEMRPLTSILDACGLISKEKIIFCLRAVNLAIAACLEGKYTVFDAHTTANCCHGMSLFARELVLINKNFDLQSLRRISEEKIESLEDRAYQEWWIPKPLIDLTYLYVLGFVKEEDRIRGGRTVKQKLKNIAPVGTSFCNTLIDGLQKKMSNLVSGKYYLYANKIRDDFVISDVSIDVWKKYVHYPNIRSDKRGVKYVPCIFSMQVSLAYLISSRAKIALINDLLNKEGELRERQVWILQGDGNQQFVRLVPEELKSFNPMDPVIVFGGCVYSDHIDSKSLACTLEPWLARFTHLVLACDVFYPQFPKVGDDDTFDSSPIIPEDDSLKDLMLSYSQTKGVSSNDPSLFCLSHIYLASLHQLQHKNNTATLPVSFIPKNKQLI